MNIVFMGTPEFAVPSLEILLGNNRSLPPSSPLRTSHAAAGGGSRSRP